MKREDLAALGLGEDVVDKVMALHGADIEALKRDKATLTAERDAARTQLGEANGKLEGYDPDWKAKAAQAQADAQAQVESCSVPTPQRSRQRRCSSPARAPARPLPPSWRPRPCPCRTASCWGSTTL